MRIDRIEIENFRCFGNAAFELPEAFTLILGDNGKGKTALLDALAVGCGAFLLGIDGAISRPIGKGEVRQVSRVIGEGPILRPRYPCRVYCEGMVGGERVGWARTINSSGGRTTTGEAREIRTLASELAMSHYFEEFVFADEEAQAADIPLFPVLGYYGTGRLWQDQRITKGRLKSMTNPVGGLYVSMGYLECLTPGSSANLLRAWVKKWAMMEFQKKQELRTIQMVYRAAAACVEGAERMTFDSELDDLALTFKDGSHFPLSHLSDGQRNMMAMVADIAMRCAQLNPHLKDRAIEETPGIILIDEIDLHLHPKWQRHVVEDLTRVFPKIQFVATTHSPFIVQSLSKGCVINLDKGETSIRKNENESIEDITEDVMGVEAPQRSQRYWDMFKAAENYYELLEKGKSADPIRLKTLKRKLDALSVRFGDDPAYVAFLEMKRKAALKDRGETSS